MKIIFDENFPPQIAKALQILQSAKSEENVEVLNLTDLYGRGIEDEYWIPKISEISGIVVTQDIRIQRTRHQRELYEKFGLGVVFLKPPSNKGYSYWEQVDKIFSAWTDIKKICRRQPRPFAFIIRPRSKKVEPF